MPGGFPLLLERDVVIDLSIDAVVRAQDIRSLLVDDKTSVCKSDPAGDRVSCGESEVKRPGGVAVWQFGIPHAGDD